MKTPRTFRPYAPDQLLLFPPDLKEWLPGDHLVYFVRNQSYNCLAAEGEKAKIIVAANVTQQPYDKQQLKPLIELIAENLEGTKPKRASADSSYFSEKNLRFLTMSGPRGWRRGP